MNPEGPRKKRKLSTLRTIRGAMADVARAIEDDTMDPGKGKALADVLWKLAELTKDREIEKRLEALEGKRRMPRTQPGIDVQ